MKKILFFFLILSFSFFLGTRAFADEFQDLQKQINDLTTALNLSINATRPLESELNSLQTKIRGIKSRISIIENELSIKKDDIDKGYKDLAKQKEDLNKVISDYYIRTSQDNILYDLLSNPSIVNWAQISGQRRVLIEKDKQKMVNFALLLIDLETQQKNLESEEAQLTALKSGLDEQSAKLDKIVSGAKAYQANLSSQIAVLSARQQQILGQRLADLGIPLYASMAGGCSSDIGKSPGFSGGFGAFTYGVPNRVGLNQFGAKGRADAGQKADTILHAYYSFDGYQNAQNVTINVNDSNGFNSGNIIWSGPLEDYVKRIYEVPNDWPAESLKAQVIAARSYVMAATNNGAMSICANQNCQVFQTNEKGGAWGQAVSDTNGQVMIQGGNPIKAWFSSTHGGYIFTSGDIGWSPTGWTKSGQDTTGSVASFADLNNNAYDKSSPWFYCDWGSVHNGTAWLTNDEFSDIVNVLLLAQADSSTKEHLYQVDRANPAGVDTWDSGRVKQELQNRGITPFNSVSGVSVSADFGSGRVNTVNVSGDRSASFGGSDFKNYFNLRAPAKVQIVGPLYNIEPVH